MKSKIIFAVATLAALTLPAVAEEGNRFKDRDRGRSYVEQQYVRPRYGYVERGDRDVRDRREFRERREHERHERRESYGNYR